MVLAEHLSTTKNIKCLIFDLGGVIVDLDLPRCIQNFKDMGVENIDHLLSDFGQSGFFLDWEQGKADIHKFREEIRKISVNPLTDKQIDEAWASFLIEIPEHRIQLLTELKKKYRIFLLSNTNPIHAEIVTVSEFNKYGLDLHNFFEKCFFSYKMGMTKPHDNIFQTMISEMGVLPEECLFLDDGEKNVDTARRLNIPSYLVTPGEDLDFLLELENCTMDFLKKESYAAAVGFFDGVHRGHQYLIEFLKDQARAQELKSLVISFGRHPRKVLNSTFQPRLLSTVKEKKKRMKEMGVDRVMILDFNEKLAQFSAKEFLQDILHRKYNIKKLIVGYDHRFGRNREDGFEDYVRYGKEVGMEIIRAKKYITDEYAHISSSNVREHLEKGEITQANQILSYPYPLTGIVSRGFSVGRKIGFPTANIIPVESDKLVPGMGVYEVNIEFNGENFRGMMNIGYRPTLENGTHSTLEVHIFDFNQEIYHEQLQITFLKKIRDEIKFNNLNELIAQLEKDKAFILNEKS